MSDEAVTEEAEKVEEQTVETTEAEAAKADAKPDGAKVEAEKPEAEEAKSVDWRAAIEDEKLREFAAKFASPSDLAKTALEFRQKLSKGIQAPGKDAPEEDVKAFRKAVGAGDDVEAYVKAFPEIEGQEATEADTTVKTKVAEVLHKHNVPMSVVPELQSSMAELASTMQAEQERVASEARQASEAALKKEWGADFDANFNLASRVIRTHGAPEFISLLENTVINGTKLGDHPDMVKLMGNIGRRMDESGFIGAVGADEKKSVQDEIDQIMRDNPPGTEKYRDPKVQARLRELNEKLYGSEPVVGAAGRAV